MGAVFEKVIPLIIPTEGSQLTNITGDDGGLTKYGISKKSFPLEDIANLTPQRAYDIYREYFWDHYGLSRFNNQDIANKQFLLLINENPYSAVRCLQKAINHCGGNTIEDGLLGIKTIQLANTLPQLWLLDRFRIEAAIFYNFRVQLEPKDLKFLRGWINRALA